MTPAAFNADFDAFTKALGLDPDVDGFTLTMMRARGGQAGEIRLRVAHAAHIAKPSAVIDLLNDYDVVLRKRLP